MGKGNSGCLEEGRRALERHLPISEDDSATGFQGYCFCDLTGRPVVSAGCALIDAYIDNGVRWGEREREREREGKEKERIRIKLQNVASVEVGSENN